MSKTAKEEIKAKEQTLIEMTNKFCIEHLDNDYQQLCEKLIKKMGRKREVPFKRGKLEVWAASVVYAIGSINFLFDKSFEPYSTPLEIADYFGSKKSTVSNKARQIKDMLKISQFDSDFSTQMVDDNNPFKSTVMVNGFIVPLDTLPEEVQEMVKQARAQGEDVQLTTR